MDETLNGIADAKTRLTGLLQQPGLDSRLSSTEALDLVGEVETLGRRYLSQALGKTDPSQLRDLHSVIADVLDEVGTRANEGNSKSIRRLAEGWREIGRTVLDPAASPPKPDVNATHPPVESTWNVKQFDRRSRTRAQAVRVGTTAARSITNSSLDAEGRSRE